MKLILLGLLVVTLPMQAQSRSERQEAKKQKKIEAYNQMKAVIDSSVYEFTARRAYTQGGRSIDLTTHTTFLRIINDSASARLPYFGKAYNIGYSTGEGGINFQGIMDNYNVKENTKKLSLTIAFKVSTSNDNFDCTLEIISASSATLTVLSQNRAYISYSGYVEKIKQ